MIKLSLFSIYIADIFYSPCIHKMLLTTRNAQASVSRKSVAAFSSSLKGKKFPALLVSREEIFPLHRYQTFVSVEGEKPFGVFEADGGDMQLIGHS